MMDNTIDLTKRYYLFSISEYYPAGGLSDVEETFDNLDEALTYQPVWSMDYNYI